MYFGKTDAAIWLDRKREACEIVMVYGKMFFFLFFSVSQANLMTKWERAVNFEITMCYKAENYLITCREISAI